MGKLRTGQRVALGVSLTLAVACTLLTVLRLLPGEAGRHLKLLQMRPEHFLEIIEETEDTPERQAVLKYIQTPAGTRRLVELYARDMLDNVSFRDASKVRLAYRWEGESGNIYRHAATMDGRGRCDEERLRVVHSLLDRIDIESVPEFSLEEYPNVLLLVRREAFTGMPMAPVKPPTPATDYVCTARLAPGAVQSSGSPRAISGLRLRRRSGTVLRGRPEIASDSAAVPTELLESLSSASAEVRERALRALGRTKILDSATARHALEDAKTQRGLLESVGAGPDDTRWEAALLLGAVRRKDEEIINRLTRHLASSSAGAVEIFLQALEPFGPSRAGTVPALKRQFEEAMKEGWIDVSVTIADALGRIGPRAAGAVPSLRRAVNHRDKDLRKAVMKAFARIGPAAGSAIPDLVDALSIRNRSLRFAALDALGSLKPGHQVVPALIRCLRHGDTLYRGRLFLVSDVLCQIGEPAVPFLTEALSHEHPTVRQGAAEALTYLGERARDAATALETSLNDQDFKVRMQAATALCNISGISGEREKALEVLREGLLGGDEEFAFFAYCLSNLRPPPDAFAGDLVAMIRTRQNERAALDLISSFGPGAADAVPVLLERLKEEDGLTYARFRALASIAPGDERVVAGLVTLLESGSAELECRAARQLAEVGPAARSALPYLLGRLRDLSRPVDPQQVPPDGVQTTGLGRSQLARRLYSRTERCRAIVDALGALGLPAAPAVPSLENLLEHEDPDLRLAAAGALWKITGMPDQSAPVLLAELRDPSSLVSEWDAGGLRSRYFFLVSRLLAEMRVDSAIPEVLAVLRDPDTPDRFSAAVALWKWNAHRVEAINVLRAGLRSDSRSARRAAAVAAGQMGSDAKPLEPLLESLSYDAHRWVRSAARRALREIHGASGAATAR